MIRLFRNHIGVKLFVLLMAMISVAVAPLAYVVFSTVSDFSTFTAEVNRDEIESQTSSYRSTMAREQAHAYDAFFSKVEVASSLMAAQARDVYDNLSEYSGVSEENQDPSGQEMRGLPVKGHDDVLFSYTEGESVPEQKSRELQALKRLDSVIRGVHQEIPENLGIHLVTVTGIYRFLGHAPTARENWSPRERRKEYEQRLKENLKVFSENPAAARAGTTWTRVYRDAVDDSPLITAASPVVDSSGNLHGAIGVDIPLDMLFTERFGVHQDGWEGTADETGFSFLLDAEGRIIVFPRKHLRLFGFADGPSAGGENSAQGSEALNLDLSDSAAASLTAVVPRLLGPAAEAVGVELEGRHYMLYMHALHRLNWHLVLVTQDTGENPAVIRTEQALSGTIRLLIGKFAVNALLVALILLVIVSLAVSYFVAPLRKLSEAALRVGRGDLKTRCHLHREDELGILADSFNDMVRQLERAEKVQQNQARQLELMVQERTRDLRNKNFMLRDVIGELNAESERRKQAVQALKKSEEQIRIVMEASLAGHGIIQDHRVKYVNQMGARVFGYDREEMTGGSFGVEDLIAGGQYDQLQRQLWKRFDIQNGRPSIISCRRKDGSVFDALVGGAVTTWEGRRAIVATVVDISDQRQTEEELRKSKLMLQDSLAEKEVLLREIYHRTKNNMLVIISMLQLQAMEIDDERVKILFRETENRIRAMSLVHEKLYQSQNLAAIDLGGYLEGMVTALVQSMVLGDHIRVEMRCESLPVSIDSIVPLGLAVNEIVTNSLKHAFRDGRQGLVYIELRQDADGVIKVVVGDDGAGLPADFDLQNLRSFGMQIAVSLIRGQLQGTLDIVRDNGTEYTIRFAEPSRPKRL